MITSSYMTERKQNLLMEKSQLPLKVFVMIKHTHIVLLKYSLLKSPSKMSGI